ncbi:hypothetical protein EW145_g6049 [Phellinidium pouzarii]|uniref:Protein kinase domain-containing protein n=1 Tax=Phellinidium pouzarii TaxID=167371 RepID=A0A4S4KXX1_9AGAM|nr:hypothetical protein EW145_g6049 [Phellinidium pouzarii]
MADTEIDIGVIHVDSYFNPQGNVFRVSTLSTRHIYHLKGQIFERFAWPRSEPIIFKLKKPLSSSHRPEISCDAEEENIYAFLNRSNNWSNNEIQLLWDTEVISEHFEPTAVEMVQVLVQFPSLKRKRVGDDNSSDESNTKPVRDADLLKASDKFITSLLSPNNSEKDRSLIMGDFFKQVFDEQGHERRPYFSNNGDLIGAPDAIWGTKCKRLLFFSILPHVMIEWKNEQGAGNSGVQVVEYYGKIIVVFQDEPFFKLTNFPMILICSDGPAFSIYSALFLELVAVNNLLTFNPLQHVDRDVVVLKIARISSVLKECALLLKTENKQIVNQVLVKSPRQCFPDPTSSPPSNPIALPKLMYREGPLRCLYVADPLPDWCADPVPPKNVIVKFSTTYNETAHKLLAEAKLAPKLYLCQRVIGDSSKAKLEPSVFEDIESALKILKTKSIVHGDLRAANIIIDPERKHAKVIDFDWAGKSGEARYPATINKKRLHAEWDFDVEPGGIMEFFHDRSAVEYLRPRYG